MCKSSHAADLKKCAAGNICNRIKLHVKKGCILAKRLQIWVAAMTDPQSPPAMTNLQFPPALTNLQFPPATMTRSPESLPANTNSMTIALEDLEGVQLDGVVVDTKDENVKRKSKKRKVLSFEDIEGVQLEEVVVETRRVPIKGKQVECKIAVAIGNFNTGELSVGALRKLCSTFKVSGYKNANKMEILALIAQHKLNRDAYKTIYGEQSVDETETAANPSTRKEPGCIFRLLNVLFSDEYRARLCELGKLVFVVFCDLICQSRPTTQPGRVGWSQVCR